MQRPEPQRGIFDSILKRGLDLRRHPQTADCRDEATIAAYCDRSLPPAQVALCEEHFSDCARCQGILAAMARAGFALDSGAARRPTSRRWELYAALAAAIAGISIVVGVLRNGGNQLASRDLLSSSRLYAPAQVAQQQNVPQPQTEMRSTNPQIALNDVSKEEKAAAAQPPPSAGFNPTESPGGRERERGIYARLQLKSMPGSSPRTRPALPPGAETEIPANSAVKAARPPQEIAGGEFTSAPAAGAPAAPRLAGRRAMVQAPAASVIGGLGLSSSTSSMISVRTADNVERWRFGPDGSIQYREPGGAWRQQVSGVTSNLRAAAAPSPTTCWIVGSGGTILRTTDAQHWQKVPAPTSADLISVFAAGADDATVTAATGARFATTDGGITWHIP